MIIFAAILVIIATLPWIVYSYSLSLIEGRPSPMNTILSTEELDSVWGENEKDLSKKNLGDITPYWFYKFFVYGAANDSLGIKITEKQMSAGTSHMAGFLALWYLRDGNFNGKGMLWRHIAGASLGMWLQRNWSPEQLAASYVVCKERITKRSRGSRH
jgi:hypothetical protein